MLGVASAPKTSLQSTNFRSMRPGAKAPGPFFCFVSGDRRAPLAEPSVNISFQILPLFCSYVIPCPASGALVAPKTCDLQVVASRTFLHVAAGHPSLRSGERYFLSGSDHAAGLGLLLFSGFRHLRSHPLHVAFRPYLIQRSIGGFCRPMNLTIIFLRPFG